MNSERSDTILFQEYYINCKIRLSMNLVIRNLAKVDIQY